MYTGGAGGYSFYVRGGEQVIRQRKNNSNYGDSASRTRAQMIRRIRWGNLVNVFKSQKAWQPKAYDSKVKGQTDYNIFMALNINQATVGFTKEMCEAGCAVIEGYQVSRGSLPPISLTASGSGNQYVTDIKISNAIQGSTTVGQLAADILANNSQFAAGDNIAFIFFRNWKTSRTEWPYASSVYAEITLDESSTTVINSIPALDNRLSKSTGGYLQASWSSAGEFEPTREVGFVAIHTRKSASMLAVSSQEILMNSNSLVTQFSGTAWDEQCILSYGLTDEVPLEPSFKGAVIENVAINGSVVPDIYGHMLSYDQPVTLVITGAGMNSNNVWLEHNRVRYTPLVVEGNKWTFILGDNGSNRIYVNGAFYGGVTLQGIEVPSILPHAMRAGQTSKSSTPIVTDDFMNDTGTRVANCINYPYLVNEEAENYIFYMRDSGEDPGVFTASNAEFLVNELQYGSWLILLSVVDDTQPAYLMLDGFIVFVFNYSE